MITESEGNRSSAAGGHGRLRASHADRERAIEVLKDAFVQGRLDKGELDARVGQAFTSRTYAELAALTADIPTASPRQPARTQNRAPRSHTARDVVIGLVIGLILAAVIVFGGLLKYGAFGVVAIPIVAVVPLVLIGNAAEQRHSRRQLPPRPGMGAQALEGQRDGGAVGHGSARPGGRPDQTGGRQIRPGGRPDRTRSDLRTHGSRARHARPLVPIPSALFAAVSGEAAWSAWSAGQAATVRADVIATVLLLAGLPLLARRFLGPPDNKAARRLRAAGYAAVLALMPAKAATDLFLGAVPRGGIDLHTYDRFHCKNEPWCNWVPGTSGLSPTVGSEVMLLLLTACGLAVVLALTARRMRVAPGTLAVGACTGLALGVVMYAIAPLGLNGRTRTGRGCPVLPAR